MRALLLEATGRGGALAVALCLIGRACGSSVPAVPPLVRVVRGRVARCSWLHGLCDVQLVVEVMPPRFLPPLVCWCLGVAVVVPLSAALALVYPLVAVEALRSIFPCCPEKQWLWWHPRSGIAL